jgi:hypothetical protein
VFSTKIAVKRAATAGAARATSRALRRTGRLLRPGDTDPASGTRRAVLRGELGGALGVSEATIGEHYRIEDDGTVANRAPSHGRRIDVSMGLVNCAPTEPPGRPRGESFRIWTMISF